MEFFSSKRFEVVDINSQNVVELGSSNTLSFYIRDIFSNTIITSLDYLILVPTGREEVAQGSYVNISDISGDLYSITFIPTGILAGKDIKFRLRITDIDNNETFLHTELYKVVGV